VPFLCIFASGYFYVGFCSLYVLWKMHQEAVADITVEAEDVVVDPASSL
jgi:hypothetical protein